MPHSTQPVPFEVFLGKILAYQHCRPSVSGRSDAAIAGVGSAVIIVETIISTTIDNSAAFCHLFNFTPPFPGVEQLIHLSESTRVRARSPKVDS